MGIPNKNIIDLNGHPLIYYTINEALKVPELDRIIVSTDSPEIQAVAESCGISVPFLRPEELGQDRSRTIDVVIHILETLWEDYNENYTYVCLLQPTSPLRTAADIKNCINILRDQHADSIVSLTQVDEPHPHKMKRIEKGIVKPFIPGTNSSVPRQELPPAYSLNGAIYLASVETIYSRRSLFSKQTIPYLMPMERSVNINNKFDLLLAKALMSGRLD